MDGVPRMSTKGEHRVDAVLTFARNVAVLAVVVLILGTLAVSAVFTRLGAVQDVQNDGIVRGYKNRVPSCVALLLAPPNQQVRLPGVCTEPAELPYVCQGAAQANAAWVARLESQIGAPCRYPQS